MKVSDCLMKFLYITSTFILRMYLINQQKIREINMKVTLLTREVNRIVSKTQINHGTNHDTDGLQN